jgi:hypothetical protein
MSIIALRELRDPFTVALAQIARGPSGPVFLRKIKAEMPLLVKQTAIGTGLTGSEQVIREEAVAAFTGTISLHLAHLTNNEPDVEKWAAEIQEKDLKTLFREGFTMIADLAKLPNAASTDAAKINHLLRPSDQPPLVILTRIARFRKEGVWLGYNLYEQELATAGVLRRGALLADWLIKQSARGTQKAIDPVFYEFLMADHIVARVMINLVRNGKFSPHLNSKDITVLMTKARISKDWSKRIDKGQKRFFEIVPVEHHQYLKQAGIVDYWRVAMKELADRTVSKASILANFSQLTGIEPYGEEG